ncbi:sororin [Scomber japonicus]|uniref:sororin n=1 Tax=Scomber japonicus TaxID=13676 RepID=UPI0023056982|nr:sororin [Scomber japonicus]
MKEKTPRSIMSESNNSITGSQRRRSPRLSSPPSLLNDNKMAVLPVVNVAVKRSITVRKIAPRKTTAPSEHNKENTPRISEGNQQQGKLKVSTPCPAPEDGRSSSGKRKKKAVMPSPILPPSSPPPPPPPPAEDASDSAWTQKVRRSYSRLSDKSFNSPNSRETLFGFEKLQTPEVGPRVRASKEASAVSLSGLNSFMSMLEGAAADDCGGSAAPEVDTDIPGVAVVKEKRRRKKVQQINSTELEELAAKMNAEFEEAEEFELIVE